MPKPSKTDTSMKITLDPVFLGVTAEDFASAIMLGQKATGSDPSTFGYHLWLKFFEANAELWALDVSIDRLPPTAFGEVGKHLGVAIAVKHWAYYQAPSELVALITFKKMMLKAGWKPSTINGYLHYVERMEKKVLGKVMRPTGPVDFSNYDFSGIPERHQNVIDEIRNTAPYS